MASSNLLGGIARDLGCACHRETTIDKVDHSMRDRDSTKFSGGGWFWLMPLSTKRGVVHVFKKNYCVKPVCVATA